MSSIKISGIYQIQSKIKPKRIYIGSTVNIGRRWVGHLSKLRNNNHANKKLQNHYNKYGKNDLVFSILIGCNKSDLIVTEQFFIDANKPWFNIALKAGSLLGYKHSDKSKKKISNCIPWNKGKIGLQEAWNKGMKGEYSTSRKGQLHSDETKKKISEKLTGIKCSKETRQKMSIAHKNMSDEIRRNISNAVKGRKMSDEFKQKIKDSWVIRKQKKEIEKSIMQTSLN